MEIKPHIPRAILIGVQLPAVDDALHAASLNEPDTSKNLAISARM